MRTNYSGLALAVSMGLIVLLIGFLALSAGGLVQLGPPLEAAIGVPADTSMMAAPTATPAIAATYKEVMPADVAAIAAGDALFKTNCAQCHAVNEKVVGPALAGITARRAVPWIVSWVHNSAKVIASGDDYSVKLFDDNSKQQMPAFPQLSDKDIKHILTWIESQQGTNVSTSGPIIAAR